MGSDRRRPGGGLSATQGTVLGGIACLVLMAVYQAIQETHPDTLKQRHLPMRTAGFYFGFFCNLFIQPLRDTGGWASPTRVLVHAYSSSPRRIILCAREPPDLPIHPSPPRRNTYTPDASAPKIVMDD